MGGVNVLIAADAAARWAERHDDRRAREGRAVTEVESPERVRKRLDRLTRNAARPAVSMPDGERIETLLSSMVGTIGLERVIGKPDFRGIGFLDLGLAVSRFVGRVHIRSTPTRTAGFGTGFMVSPRLLLTNNHVLPTPELVRHSDVEFDFQNDRNQRPMPVVPFAFEPQTFFLTDRALDFTLIAVAERSRGGATIAPYGWSRLIGEEGKALLGDPLNIIQHPRGELKQIVFRSNELVDLFDQYAHYTSDTEQGSSGSPVYNDQWEVVALHHSGVPRRGEDGRLLTRDGRVWRQGVDDAEELDWIANEGIRVSALVRFVEQAQLRSNQQELRRDLLEREPPDPVIAAADQGGGMGGRGGERETAMDGSITIEVPLRITVSLGPSRGTSPPIAISTSMVDGAGTDAATKLVGAPPGAGPALDELARARTRTYYDASADGAARDRYWSGIATADRDPRAFFAAVSEVVESTHRNRLPYRPALHVYPWVDLRPGDRPVLKSIYSNQPFDPRELIEEEFRLEAERERLIREGLLSSEMEADLPFNCEHVVPQSWFAKREPMRGDLHHLFTCEMRCNSFRSNTPYFDFPDFEEAVRDDCGRSERNRFEPVAGKGAVARATLYFLVRYPGEIADTAKEYQAERIDTLVAWHKRYPTDEYERHRNAAIAEKQGNRNPFIDHPNWVDRIDLREGLVR